MSFHQTLWIAATLTLACTGGRAAGQEGKADASKSASEALRKLETTFARKQADLDRSLVVELDALADWFGREGTPASVDLVATSLFRLALDRGQPSAARPAAERVLASDKANRDVRALAALVLLTDDADRGDDLKALGRLRDWLKPDVGLKNVPLAGVGEHFVQTLVRLGRPESARDAAGALANGLKAPAEAAHFRARHAFLGLVGKPAPAIALKDVDGKPFRLDDLKGKVVLVSFWATWCPPCLAELPRLSALAARHAGGREFEVLGVNVDAHHDDIADVASARPIVRHALIEHGVTWPNVFNDDGPNDAAKAYGVETVPAYVLIGRDGKILAVDLEPGRLPGEVDRAFARPKP